MSKFDTFISYRREGGEDVAARIKLSLEKKGYRVFMDRENLDAGYFDTQIKKHIEESKDLILICSKNIFDRCVQKEDWIYQEILYATNSHKNIIPVWLEGHKKYVKLLLQVLNDKSVSEEDKKDLVENFKDLLEEDNLLLTNYTYLFFLNQDDMEKDLPTLNATYQDLNMIDIHNNPWINGNTSESELKGSVETSLQNKKTILSKIVTIAGSNVMKKYEINV